MKLGSIDLELTANATIYYYLELGALWYEKHPNLKLHYKFGVA